MGVVALSTARLSRSIRMVVAKMRVDPFGGLPKSQAGRPTGINPKQQPSALIVAEVWCEWERGVADRGSQWQRVAVLSRLAFRSNRRVRFGLPSLEAPRCRQICGVDGPWILE